MDLVARNRRKGPCFKSFVAASYELLAMHAAMRTPPPISLQNIENKQAEKNLTRKILQPKELESKSLIQRTYVEKPRSASQRHIAQVVNAALVMASLFYAPSTAHYPLIVKDRSAHFRA
jgi:hypothetical protein